MKRGAVVEDDRGNFTREGTLICFNSVAVATGNPGGFLMSKPVHTGYLGVGRTCCNHVPDLFEAIRFTRWFHHPDMEPATGMHGCHPLYT